MFAGKTVALLLVGEPFRPPRHQLSGDQGNVRSNEACLPTHTHHSQHIATASFVRHVIVPLEKAQANVSVLMTVPRCRDANYTREADGDQHGSTVSDTLTSERVNALRKWLSFDGTSRVVGVRVVDTLGVGHSWLAGYTLLERYQTKHGVEFDLSCVLATI